MPTGGAPCPECLMRASRHRPAITSRINGERRDYGMPGKRRAMAAAGLSLPMPGGTTRNPAHSSASAPCPAGLVLRRLDAHRGEEASIAAWSHTLPDRLVALQWIKPDESRRIDGRHR